MPRSERIEPLRLNSYYRNINLRDSVIHCLVISNNDKFYREKCITA